MVIAKKVIKGSNKVIQEEIIIARWQLGEAGSERVGSGYGSIKTENIYIREAETSDYKTFDFKTMTGIRK